MTILSKPWRIDRRGERIYIDAPGEVCVDICSGTPEDRARVMALLEQVQKMAALLLSQGSIQSDGDWHLEMCWDMGGNTCSDDCNESRKVLWAAGVLDE